MEKTYEVSKEFIAREHNEKYYAEGDHYDSSDADRVAYLQKLGFLGDEVRDADDELDERLKHVGGGYYELPNGEKVRGRPNAIEALKTLDEASAKGGDENDDPIKGE